VTGELPLFIGGKGLAIQLIPASFTELDEASKVACAGRKFIAFDESGLL